MRPSSTCCPSSCSLLVTVPMSGSRETRKREAKEATCLRWLATTCNRRLAVSASSCPTSISSYRKCKAFSWMFSGQVQATMFPASGCATIEPGGQHGNQWRPAATKALGWLMLPGALSPTGQPQLDVDFVRLEPHRRSSLMMWEGPFNASLALLATANQILTPPNVSHVPRAPQPACMEAQDALRATRETINQMRLRPLASRAVLPEQHSCWVHHLWQIAFAKKGKSRNFPHAWSVMSKACIAREVALLRSLRQQTELQT